MKPGRWANAGLCQNRVFPSRVTGGKKALVPRKPAIAWETRSENRTIYR